MLTDFCISETAVRNRPRKRKGLLKMAHTGKAALNIHGWTIHTALGMRPDNSSTPNDATSFKIHSLKDGLGDLLLIIIDEISLVSHSLFQKINKRLNQIFNVSDKSSVYFGNIPILLFGDLAQCEPVAAKQIFWEPPGESFSLWRDLFRPINFNINMRQGDDRLFFYILCRIRLGQYTDEDEIIIKKRSIREEDNPKHYQERLNELNSLDFANAVYAYSVRSKTNERNCFKLKEITTRLKTTVYIIQSIDKVGMARTLFFKPLQATNKQCKVILKPSDDENECGSMLEQLPLCIGARVICRRNIDFDQSIVNGTEATVKNIVWNNDDDIILSISNKCLFPYLQRALRVTLPKYVELELDNGSIYKMTPEEVSFKDKNGIWMTRKQLPLSLGYAITVHRSQCMTYNKLVIDLTDIIILAYNRKSFKVSKPALNEMLRLQKLEENYPIKIEDYLRTERYIDWNLSQSFKLTEPISSMHENDMITTSEQEQNYCGRHALRALTQNMDLFSDSYLIEIAKNLAINEQIIRNTQSVNISQYTYKDSGDYDIQILNSALLNIFNIELIQIHNIEITTCPLRSMILSNTELIQGFLIQQNYHYYCLRRFRLTKEVFFKIDSKISTYHERIPAHYILDFIKRLLQCKANIYIPIEHLETESTQELSIEKLAKRLWILHESPADLEPLACSF
ncbi:unnamed protein product [Rotaria socialis]|uniref:ATP-dependent DNA helicase n=1 Tax=Rotaria socialis TaxID=392032 RepID=A0A821S5I8_9BILA|nr:unnamed protein product [Rotaria socialis]